MPALWPGPGPGPYLGSADTNRSHLDRLVTRGDADQIARLVARVDADQIDRNTNRVRPATSRKAEPLSLEWEY